MFHHFPTIALSAALGAVVFETTQAKPAQLETEAAGNGIEQGWWDNDRRLDRLEGKVEELRETAPANAAETNAVPAAVSVGNLFFSRPVIRAYLTYAGWGAQFKGRVGGNDFANRSDGWAWASRWKRGGKRPVPADNPAEPTR